jgi:hypothetical protein
VRPYADQLLLLRPRLLPFSNRLYSVPSFDLVLRWKSKLALHPLLCQLSGYVLVNSACVQCSSPCLTCSINRVKCDSCISGTYLSGSNCITCTSPCSSCSTPVNCLSCVPGFNFISGFCLQCTINQFWSGRACESCHPRCLSCSGELPTNCLSCRPGFLSQPDGTCVCPPGQFFSVDTCLPCASPCQNCELTAQNCLSCVPGTNFFASTCIQCSISEFWAGASCQSCHSACNSCSGPAADQLPLVFSRIPTSAGRQLRVLGSIVSAGSVPQLERLSPMQSRVPNLRAHGEQLPQLPPRDLQVRLSVPSLRRVLPNLLSLECLFVSVVPHRIPALKHQRL